MDKQVLHIGAWGRNWGDHAIQYSMRTNLDEAFRRKRHEVEWTYVDIQTEDFSEFDFAPYDLVIVGGGGLLWDKPELESPSGWQWRIPAQRLLEMDAPLVLYGLGYTAFPYHDQTDKELMWSHLRIAAGVAALVSVRNTQTRSLLRAHGLPKVHNIPDPALTLGRNGNVPPTGIPEARIIGLCWASDKPMMRFGNEARYDHWLERYAAFLAAAATDFDVVLMVEHIEGMDGRARDVFRSHLGSKFLSVEEDIGMLTPPCAEGVPAFFSVYDRCEVVFSARKHGVWIPAGKGVPTIGLGSMAEVKWSLDSVGMGVCHVPPENLDLWPEYSGTLIGLALEGTSVYERSLVPLRRALARFDAKVAGLL